MQISENSDAQDYNQNILLTRNICQILSLTVDRQQCKRKQEMCFLYLITFDMPS